MEAAGQSLHPTPLSQAWQRLISNIHGSSLSEFGSNTPGSSLSELGSNTPGSSLSEFGIQHLWVMPVCVCIQLPCVCQVCWTLISNLTVNPVRVHYQIPLGQAFTRRLLFWPVQFNSIHVFNHLYDALIIIGYLRRIKVTFRRKFPTESESMRLRGNFQHTGHS